jgi:hypothetical protein
LSIANTNGSVTPGASWVAVYMKKKEEAMNRIAESMTATMVVENHNQNSRRSEKMQLERDTGASL